MRITGWMRRAAARVAPKMMADESTGLALLGGLLVQYARLSRKDLRAWWRADLKALAEGQRLDRRLVERTRSLGVALAVRLARPEFAASGVTRLARARRHAGLIPLKIRDVPPFEGAVRLTGTRPDGLPDGVHTGGAWRYQRLVYKPLDGRPWANAEHHLRTNEAAILERLAGKPGFPRNWLIAQRRGRYFLVRHAAQVIPEDFPYASLRHEDALQVEAAVRTLNAEGWELGDALRVAIDDVGQLFLLDLSNAGPIGPMWMADDSQRVLRWFEEAGFHGLARLRREGQRAVPRGPGPARRLQHVYARARDTGAPLPAGVVVKPAGSALGEAHEWLLAPEPLAQDTCRALGAAWAWSPLEQRTGR
jgi:hypothetical protein